MQTAEAGRAVEHVAAPLKRLGALAVEDGAAIDLRGDLKGDTGGKVGFDDAGDHVHRRSLGREDGVDAHGARHLGETCDGRLDLGGGGHHEIGQLIDDEHDKRKFGETLDDGLGVVTGEVAHVFFGENFIAPLHLAYEPLQRLAGLFRVGHDRVNEVGQIAIDGELDDLGVDKHEFQLVGAKPIQQRKDNVADTDGFAAARRSGDERVGGLREVANHVASGDIHAKHDGKVGLGLAPRGGLKGSTQRERHRTAVGNLDADEALARDGGLDAHRVGGEREGEIFFESGDGLHPNAEAGFDAKLGNARADHRIVDKGIHGEAIQRGLQKLFVGLDLFRRDEFLLGRRRGPEQVEHRQLVARDILGRKRRRRRRDVLGRSRVGHRGDGLPDRGDVGLSVAGVFAQGIEVVERVLEAIPVTRLELGALLAARREFLPPKRKQPVIFRERGVLRPDGRSGRANRRGNRR